MEKAKEVCNVAELNQERVTQAKMLAQELQAFRAKLTDTLRTAGGDSMARACGISQELRAIASDIETLARDLRDDYKNNYPMTKGRG
jgi:hypothetical protein